jgi:hypothetical protein
LTGAEIGAWKMKPFSPDQSPENTGRASLKVRVAAIVIVVMK